VLAGCGGVWLDHEVLGRLLRDRQRQAPVRERLLSMPLAQGQAAEDARKVVYLRCPECAVLMNRRNPAHRSGIIVDVCAGHGVWFDDRELAILLQMASSGAELNVAARPKMLQEPGGSTAPSGLTGNPGTRAGQVMRRREREYSIDSNPFDLDSILQMIERLF
jgi:Zn-finger nucleic acid-binding protein